MPDFREIDLNIARARIVLCLIAMLSLYVDPATAGGLFHLSSYAALTLICHFAYSAAVYFAVRRVSTGRTLIVASAAGDLLFATAIAFLTEGETSPSYMFFVFAIIAVGIRSEMRATVLVTLCGVALYLVVIAVSDGVTNLYMMRSVYLAIAGYLIGFLGKQRTMFEARVREFESKAERHLIARSLHDGYVQALAGMNLRLETCRQLLIRKRADGALSELSELQSAVAREYDSVRAYIRSLAGVSVTPRNAALVMTDPALEMCTHLTTRADVGEHVLRIALEGLHNARRHSNAAKVSIRIDGSEDKILIAIDDDGIGFAESEELPWAIASRVTELGGHLRVSADGAARLEIEMPNS